ncbi:MAG: FAD-dependent oxidoreductase [Rhizobiaceae bacterium]
MTGGGQSAKHVAIIGAGIVGVSTAIWLQRAGHSVTLIDSRGVAGGTSYGNAGVLASASIVPVSVPGLLKKAPGMLFNKDGPLFLRWSYLPKLLPFLIKFLGHGNVKDVNRIADGLALMLRDSADQHVAVAKGTGAEKYVTVGDYVFGYADRSAYEGDVFGWDLRRAREYEFEEMDAQRIAEYDPAMAGRFGFAVRCPEHGHISDPGEYVKALASHVEKQGGKFLMAEATDLQKDGDQITGVITDQGVIEADDVVLATGVWSGPLAEKLGIAVPLEAERGYHIEFVNPSIKPKSPVMVASGKYVMTPMAGRLRCAGIVEFGGLTEERSRAPFELLKRQTMKMLPELTYDSIDEWMGFRPSTTDSLPLIGASERYSNVWTGFGHQHIGLSAGPKTGRWLAQMIDGQKPNIDLTAFSPLRFNK